MDGSDRDYVRSLAGQVAEIAASPENALIQRRWRDVNGLRKPDRAPVWCRPVGAWGELLPEAELRCADRRLRSIERNLRMTLIKHEIGDDSPVDPDYPVRARFDYDPPNVWGVDLRRHESDDPGGAYAFDPPLRAADDFAKLRLPRLTFNPARTEEDLARTADVLGDTLPVRVACEAPQSATLGTTAIELRGLDQAMLDMAADPPLAHRLMGHIRDGVLGAMRDVAATGLLTRNNTGPMYCSDPLGPAPANGHLTYKHLWGQANSQEFQCVSPAMWEEFLLNYQIPVLEQFGLVSYGCCEDLTHKIDGVLRIPNLRIFVSSGWTNLDLVVEKVGTRHTIMWRQKATEVVFPDDVESIRQHLDDGMRRLQGCYVQVVLRELQTLAGHPDRLHVWTRLAIEAAERYS